MRRPDMNPGPCHLCGGPLEWKATVSAMGPDDEVQFYECERCHHVVERDPQAGLRSTPVLKQFLGSDATERTWAVPSTDPSSDDPNPTCPNCDVPMWLIEVARSKGHEGQQKIYHCQLCDRKLVVSSMPTSAS